MLPEATLCHDTQGRTRLRVASHRKNVEFFKELPGKLSGLRGIEKVETNALTGSILLVHQTSLPSIARFARERKLFDVCTKDHKRLVTRVAHKMNKLDRHARLSSVAFVGLVGLGIWQISRGQVFGPATTLFSDAMKLLPRVDRISHRFGLPL